MAHATHTHTHIHETSENTQIKHIQYPTNGYIPPKNKTYILGIESTCDETSLALVKDGVEVIEQITLSQAKQHAQYGGVVPELAAREHLKNFNQIAPKFLDSIKKYPIDYVAVAYKIGLPPAVKVGEAFALGLAKSLNKPLIKVNHVLAHIWGVWVDDSVWPKPNFPFLGVIISGGHTQLAIFKSPTQYEIIGETIDDAIGETFDKVARVLGYGYPGGPAIEKHAKQGDPTTYKLPLPLSNSHTKHGKYDLSFAGLKTAVLNLFNKQKQEYEKLQESNKFEHYLYYIKTDIAASFQDTAFLHLIDKIILALKDYKLNSIVFGGGVSANNRLYDLLWQQLSHNKINAYIYAPSLRYCTDNASLIAGYAINLIKPKIENSAS